MSDHAKKVQKITEEERNLFREAVADVKPLKPSLEVSTEKNISVTKQHTITINIPKPSRRLQTHHAAERKLPILHEPIVFGNDVIAYFKSGIQYKLRSQLRQGKLKIEATLDLHLQTEAQALQSTFDFIARSKQSKKRLICIIHGKGQDKSKPPVIKNSLNQALRQHPDVLAFHSAKPKHGGTGAMYVLLQSMRRSKFDI